MEYNEKYKINIYERYSDLKKSGKIEYNNNDLCKIFEYYSCIKLTDEYSKQFYEYDDIDPTFKEINKMSRNDTGIDCCDLDRTIVQCKLRKDTLTWKECGTFFGSQNIYCNELNKLIIRWDKLIITRNDDCKLSQNLLERKDLFIDKLYNKKELITFCENLIINPPSLKYLEIENNFKLRDYQQECIDKIIENNKNIIINLPTGTGKNSVIIYSIKDNLKYLILVPRIILMEQLREEIIKHKPLYKKNIQLIGNNNNNFDENKLITICVFNSVHLIEKYCMNFEKIYIDEAHHINKPAIYYDNEEEYNDDLSETDLLELETDIELLDLEFDNVLESSIEKYKLYTTDKLLNEINFVQDDNEINNVNYTKIIENLVKYNNNVYLSATIDQIDSFEYYSKDLRDMIDKNYLCDYQIHVPIFNDDPTNKNICEHLIKNYRSIIIYCNSQKEGKQINKLMNELQLKSSEYIDCKTPNKLRKDIISRYKEGKIAFLVNVRILVEGFDAPITKGVCFMHLPSSKTTLIQIIGRALRKHETKIIANIILPFSSSFDEKNICNFLKVIAKNDKRVKQSFENKKLGGYINIDKIDKEDEEEDNEENNEIEFKYNMIYDSMGILQNGKEIWMKRLEEVKKYIDENNKAPSNSDKDKFIKKLAQWIGTQKKNYNIDIIKCKCIMKNEQIYNTWTEFINNNQYQKYIDLKQLWYEKLEQVKEYINKNKKTPSNSDKNKEIKQIASWISNQKTKYSIDINKCKEVIKNIEIYNKWTDFITNNKYKKYIMIDLKELWYTKLEQVKNYIDKNNKRPSIDDNDQDIKQICYWIGTQKKNYNIDADKCKDRMKDTEIYNKWTEFITNNKYKKYFVIDLKELWYEKLEEVKNYIDKYNKRPSKADKDEYIKQIGQWISDQIKKYDININKCIQIMKDEEIYNKWTEFINNNKYNKYFNTKNWYKKLEEVKEYIDKNNKIPLINDKKENFKQISIWINNQKKNYNIDINKCKQSMKDEEIYNKWTDFINDIKYKKYIIINYKELWYAKLEQVKNYIDKNNKKPSEYDKDEDIKQIGKWIGTQKQYYDIDINKCQFIMKDYDINNTWTEFITNNKYQNYLIDFKELWYSKLKKVKNYIDENNKRPSESDKNQDIKQIGHWICCQRQNYNIDINKCKNGMKDIDIYNKWTEFITDNKYKKYIDINLKELWYIKLEKIKNYIDKNNKIPSKHDKDQDIKQIGIWIGRQKQKYNIDITKCKEGMKDEEIYNKWTEFINNIKYKKYFKIVNNEI